MIEEIPFALLVSVIVLIGLYLSNLALDAGMPQYLSRKFGHVIGGVAYVFFVFFFTEPWWPLIISGGFVMLLGGARILKPRTFRGVGGSARAHAFAEVYFPLAGTISLAIGWAWLGNPWLAVVPILYMAWGDCITGLLRSRFYGREVKGNIGSYGMLLMCLLVAYLFSPYWMAVVGAVTATLAERFTPLSKGIWDDNHTIVLSSLAVMALLYKFVGG